MEDCKVRIGTAGWSIPRALADAFPETGSGLERYSAVFNSVEINSTFYRPHRASTFARWAESTPPAFRFAVKAPRTISHDARLANAGDLAAAFLEALDPLQEKLAVLLLQLPPSLAFDASVAEPFFAKLRKRDARLPVACEPRHTSWFEPDADSLLAAHRIARVAADPARHALDAEPGGWLGLQYHRLHGSPQIYRSAYGDVGVQALARTLKRAAATETWCIFDNTASGAAAADALRLKSLLS